MICEKCKKEFEPRLQAKEHNKKGIFLICPHCGLKYSVIFYYQGLKQLPSGQLVRKVPKIKMSKKD